MKEGARPEAGGSRAGEGRRRSSQQRVAGALGAVEDAGNAPGEAPDSGVPDAALEDGAGPPPRELRDGGAMSDASSHDGRDGSIDAVGNDDGVACQSCALGGRPVGGRTGSGALLALAGLVLGLRRRRRPAGQSQRH